MPSNSLTLSGMVKHCHKTLELVLKKCMEWQEDWYELLNSVLLGMRSQVHSLSGYSPIRMLFNKDPILPFQISKCVKGESNETQNECDESIESGAINSIVTTNCHY